ncbi:hypothetical protein OIU84_002243 [Salix udensis]|uniref:Uncharacterized protein n=1 Tax=Salix udensis TaxID=889485 RepID=A0AAD6P536_9ROSI|nr:hypothetical protein OIU84_002243 [Salix udensis]
MDREENYAQRKLSSMDQLPCTIFHNLPSLERAKSEDFHQLWPASQRRQQRNSRANQNPTDGISSPLRNPGNPSENLESQGLRFFGCSQVLAPLKSSPLGLRPPPLGFLV